MSHETGTGTRLLAAAAAVVAGLGIGGFEIRACRAAEAKGIHIEQGLEHNAQWNHLRATWSEAGLIASGAKGMYPFTEPEKRQLMAELQQIAQDIDQLERAGLLAEAEAGLLRMDLPGLVSRIIAFRPKGTEMALCYSPMALPPPDAHKNVAQRMELLQKLAAGKALRPEVLGRVLDLLEGELRQLSDETYLRRYPTDAERKQAIEARDRARKQLEPIRAAIKSQIGDLESAPQWKKIIEAWKETAPLARSGQSTTRQREQAKQNMESALAGTRQLAGKGLLAEAEAELLVSEGGSMLAAMYRNPPTDSQVTCYDMVYVPPARASEERLAKRLPLLTSVVERGQVNPAAIERVLPTIEEDIRILSTKAEIEKLQPERRAVAERTRAECKVLVGQIKALLEKGR